MKCFLAAVFVLAGVAQQLPQAYATGNGVTQPKVLSKIEPQYSEEARIAGLNGSVTLMIIVQPDGTPANIRVTKSLGLGLDENAVEAVSHWRFEPGRKQGDAVPVFARIDLNFRLLNKGSGWMLKNAAFDVPDGASRAVVTKAKLPESNGDREVTVVLEIDENGAPQNVATDGSAAAPDLVDAVREWGFRPASKSGTALKSAARFTFAPVAPVIANRTEPAHLAKVERLITLLQADRTLLILADQFAKTMETQVEDLRKRAATLSMAMPSQLQLEIEDLRAQIKALFLQTVRERARQAYAESFSDQELDSLIELFSTPAGKLWTSRQGEVQSANAAVDPAEISRRFQKLETAWLEKLKAKYPVR